jgi:hypothetical protein
MSDPAWVPQFCALPAEERPLRVVEWDDLFAQRLVSLSLSLSRSGPLGLVNHVPEPGVYMAARSSASAFSSAAVVATVPGTVIRRGDLADGHFTRARACYDMVG